MHELLSIMLSDQETPPKRGSKYGRIKHVSQMRELGEETFGEWLYPNADYGGGGWADDRHLVHIGGPTSDSLEQVREFYWARCEWTHGRSPGDGGSTYLMDRYPERIFRNGPPMIVLHATEERTISVVAVASSAGNQVELYLTREDH